MHSYDLQAFAARASQHRPLPSSTMSIWNFGQRIHIMTYRKTELGDQVLAIAGEHQDAKVLDDVDAIPPVPPTPLIVVAQLSTLQAYKRTHI